MPLLSVKRWKEVEEGRSRFKTLVQFLKAKHRAEPRSKLIIFAGFPGLAQRLHQQLSIEFATKKYKSILFRDALTNEKDEEARGFVAMNNAGFSFPTRRAEKVAIFSSSTN